MKIVLASGSPRRRELLQMIGIADFAVIPDETEEQALPGLSPERTVIEIAMMKAKNVSRFCDSDDIIIAADTLVYIDGVPLGKPADTKEAADMLRRLSARHHTVHTGVAIIKGEESAACAERTEVFFRDLTDAEISAYIKTGEPMDKAGAYGVQGGGAVFVERIEGDFFSVMGLPLCRLSIMLREFGIFVL